MTDKHTTIIIFLLISYFQILAATCPEVNVTLGTSQGRPSVTFFPSGEYGIFWIDDPLIKGNTYS